MKILIYADLDLRLIDGSSTWLASLAEVLAEGGNTVHLLSKVNFTESRVLERLRRKYPHIHIEMPDSEESALTPDQAANRAEELDGSSNFDAIFVRGFDACFAFSRQSDLSLKLWSYITDLPFPVDDLSRYQSDRLQRVASASHRMFAQTEAARSYLEAVAPPAAGKTLLLPPMIPMEAFKLSGSAHENPLRLIYAGKFAKQWHTFEMLALPQALRSQGIDAELIVIGDKFQHDVHDHEWAEHMRRSLTAADKDPGSGVTWLGGLPRDRVLEEISKAHIGIGWRSSVLDSSLELSTKALEYAACATAPLVNLSADHRALWGDEYPLLIPSDASVEEVANRIAATYPNLVHASTDARDTAAAYSMTSSVARLNRYLKRGARSATVADGPTKIVISAHDFKFLGELVDGLKQRGDYVLDFDGWTSLHEHDEASSKEKATGADVVLCEWAGPSLVWHAEHKRPGVKLIARLHGFELRGTWLADLQVDAVDHWVFVSEWYRRLAVDQLHLDLVQTSVIPNMIDSDDFDRPKLPGSAFQLGMVGIVGFGKRPDRALDLLEQLVDIDERYSLRIKGRQPWDYPHEWRDPLQRQLYMDFYTRIRSDEKLKSRVAFESFSPDVASWLRGVGFVLSPSHNESFHLAPVEGMASGAVPIIWEREGAEEIFGHEWMVEDTTNAAQRVLTLNNASALQSSGERARKQSLQWDRDQVLHQWFELIGEK